MYGDWTPDVQGHKTQHPPDEDPGHRVSEDFVGARTLWDRGFRRIEDFVGFRTS